MRSLYAVLSILVVVCAAGLTGHASQPRYRVTILDDPKHQYCLEARGINDAGVVVGVSVRKTSSGTHPEWHAFLYRHGKYNGVGILPGCTFSEAVAINDRNEIVGISSAIGRPQEAFIWRSGRLSQLPAIHGGECNVYAIDNAGDVAGSVTLPDGRVAAAVWHCGTTGAIKAPTVYDRFDRAVAASTSGDLVTVNGAQSYLVNDGRDMRLGTLGGTDAVCSAMNDLGDVVGVSTTKTELTHAFLWRRGVILDVSTFKSLDNTSPVLSTESINDLGQIVGTVRYGTDTRAMVMENGHQKNLNHLIQERIVILDIARQINNRGQIIGQGHAGAHYVSYLLTPIVPTNAMVPGPVSAFSVTPAGFKPNGPPPGTLAAPKGGSGA